VPQIEEEVDEARHWASRSSTFLPLRPNGVHSARRRAGCLVQRIRSVPRRVRFATSGYPRRGETAAIEAHNGDGDRHARGCR
jgi:hypothetical protein